MRLVGISRALGTIPNGIKQAINRHEIGPILLDIDNVLAVRRNSEVVDKDRMFKEKGPRRCIIKAKAWMERSRNHHCHRLPFHGLHL